MKLLVFFLLCLAMLVNSSPMTRRKRAVMTMTGGGWPFGGTGAFAGAGGWPMPGPMLNPWDFSRSFVPIPWPMFPIPTRPWYEGENVCTTSKEIEDPKELQEWFAEASSPNVDYNHESEQCQGTGSKYVCFKRYVSNGVSKMQVTKYECCHGFVRNAGSGCIESPSVAQATGGRNPQDTYFFVPMQTSTPSSRSGVDKVPIQ